MKYISKMLIAGYFRRRKKEWKSITLVVLFCTMFFSMILSSCLDAILSIEQYTKQQYGNHQFQVFDVNPNHKKHARAEIGTMMLKGYFVNDVSLYRDAVILGTVDEAAKEIGNLFITEGQMPEKKGEIAIETSVLKRMNLKAGVGDEITLPVYWSENGKYQSQSSQEKFTITGIINDYSHIWMTEFDDPKRGFPGIWLSEKEQDDVAAQVELIYLDDIKTTEQLDKYYEELSEIYGGDVIEYNINSYMASENDSTEMRKSLYLTVAAVIMGIAIVVIMIIGIVSVLSLGIEERKKQQKILYQLGVNKRLSFLILCGQIYGASLLGVLPGVLISFILSKGLRKLILRLLGIYRTNSVSLPLMIISVCLILLTIGIACIAIYRMLNRNEDGKIRKSRTADYIQRICNGSFQIQRMLSIILLIFALLIIFPVQIAISYYQNHFSHALEQDVSITLNSNLVSGCLAVSEGRKGITLDTFEELNAIDGLENMRYAMQIEAAKILLPNAELKNQFEIYASDNETVPKIENIDMGDGKDYISRDKEYYGYMEEEELIPCTIQGVDWSLVEQLSSDVVSGTLNKNAYTSGEEIYAVVWEEDYKRASYPIQTGEKITLTNLVQTEASPNYQEIPDEVSRVDTTAKVGGIIQIPLELKDELGCTFVHGSFTFLRSIEALEKDGHDISFQSVFFDYAKNADMNAVDEKIRDTISHYNFVDFESKYEKLKAEKQFEMVVLILAGSVWILGIGLSILLIYQKMISTIMLKKRQLHIMWCMGMHKNRLNRVVTKESILCVSYAVGISLMSIVLASRFMPAINLGMTSVFILGSGGVTLIILICLLRKWIKKIEL